MLHGVIAVMDKIEGDFSPTRQVLLFWTQFIDGSWRWTG